MMERMVSGIMGNRTNILYQSNMDGLSDRELQVFELIGRGFGTSQIAKKLSLSIKTVETHRANIKKKLHLDSNNELILQAMHWTLEQH